MAYGRRRRPVTELPGQEALFAWTEPLASEQPEIRHAPWFPVWSHNKARLVAEYLRLFLQITKHGTYIDGFAGPQGDEDAWCARHVLELEPRWLRRFELSDSSRSAVARLQQLREMHADRDVHVHGPVDFNAIVERLLAEIPPKEATFCLLDQRTFECHWDTVRALATFKAGSAFKIELFYFLANSWLDRAIAATTTAAGREEITRWWGRPDWHVLRGQGGWPRAQLVAERLREEFGYRFAVPWELRHREDGSLVMFYMVHATDHPAAPDLMARAYQSAVGDGRSSQLWLFPG